MEKINLKKSVLSCIQPTNEMHIGNYFGAVINWVEMQDKYECVFGVVDYHALTTLPNPTQLRENTIKMVINLLACGVDSEKCTLFVQSLIPEHAELNWIFSCVCPYGQLTRMTQFKEKSKNIRVNKKDSIVSTGLLVYPVLQSADILIYKPDLIPVGKDQKQHVELCRDIAESFNNKYTDYFPLPKPVFTKLPKLLSLADPSQKMSKSLGDKHYIGLFEDANSIRQKVKSAVTDTGNMNEGKMSAGVSNLFEIIKACKNSEYDNLINDHMHGTLKYVQLKDAVSNSLVSLTSGFIERQNELLEKSYEIEEKIEDMSAKARAIARATIKDVREIVGLPKRNRF